MKKLYGVYKLSRIETIVSFVLFLTVLGAFISGQSINPLKLFLIFLANLLSVTFAFMINDAEDADDDAMDLKKKKRNPVSAGLLSKKDAYIASFSTAAAALLLYLFAGFSALGAGISLIICGFLYSWKEIRFKNIAWADFISHGFFLSAGILLASYLAFRHFSVEILPAFIGTWMFSMSGDLYNEIRDFAVDRKSKLKNTAHFLGMKKTVIMKNVLAVVSAVSIVILLALEFKRIYLPSLLIILVVLIAVLAYNRLKSKTPLLQFDNMLLYDPLLLSFSLVLMISIFV